MKKIFFLAALLSASVLSFSAQYCHEELTNGNHTIYLSCQMLSEGNYQIKIEADVEMSGLGGSFCHVNENQPYQLNASGHFVLSDDHKTITLDIESTTAPNLYTPLYVLMPGEVSFGWPSDIEWGLCGSAEAKSNPELSLNETEVSLDAAAAETFQIVATQSGDGAISYESNNAGIATVSEAGLVTAVGRGKAIITVRVAETETYAAANKKLEVTVNGPINWDAVSWLGGSDDKYKMVATPEIADNFGGKHVENNSLWIGFPSADFGEMSIEPNNGAGAWKTFALSNFPNKQNQFTVVCGGVTYTIDVYYADGAEGTSAIDLIETGVNVEKMIENGQLVIIKNGVRLNAAGQVIR